MPPTWTCHCSVGVGEPVAAPLNVAVAPTATVVLPGLSRIVGAYVATPEPGGGVPPDPTPLRLATPLVAVPAVFVATSWKRSPAIPAVTPATLNMPVVVPLYGATSLTFDQLPAPPTWTCHCSVGVGDPVAAPLNVAVAPTATTVLPGFSRIVGAYASIPANGLSVAGLLIAVPTGFVATRRN